LLRAVADLVLSTTYDGVWLIDAKSRTSFVNERMGRILGYDVREMLGRSLFDFMDENGKKITEQNLSRRQRGASEQHEFKCIRKDGTPIWLLVSANPVYDRAGRYAGALALIADFSIQRAHEEALTAAKLEAERKLEEMVASRASLEALAYKDPLTGLFSRAYLEERLHQEMARCRRHARRLSLLFLDVDGLKAVNDRYGHAAGDEVLKTVGRIMGGPAPSAPLLRQSDVAARYGGDEIVIVAPETDPDGGYALAERIHARLRETPVRSGKAERLSVSVSVGVASCPFHATDPASLIAAADTAMYKAKRAGGAQSQLAERPSSA
jgi:diguanylate cyclase (GGDEF)-like protein/PAS domain S-box-containing protein